MPVSGILRTSAQSCAIPSLATSTFQTLTSIFVPEMCLCGVQMESNSSAAAFVVAMVTTPF